MYLLACRHGSKAGILDAYEGHQGPITGISTHSASGGAIDFSDLFLTSSIDWTVKLWSVKVCLPDLVKFLVCVCDLFS